MIADLKADLQRLQNPKKAQVLQRFFKTGKGEYGEGDRFLGITVPEQRRIALKYADLNLENIRKLLDSEIHEHRLTALLILVEKFRKSDDKGKNEIFNFYIKNIGRINNWDMVDLTSEKIIGEFLIGKDKSLLYKLAKSENIWKRRIAIISTYAFIKKDKFQDSLNIAESMLNDKHDLIHKAAGWMLREIGKRDKKTEITFLNKHCKNMPRTMLRYAIEKFTSSEKDLYIKK